MKRLTRISGILFLGMLLMMGRALAAVTPGASARQHEVMEQPPVVEVVTPAGQDQPQADARRSAVWYRQMHRQMRLAKSAAKAAVATPVFSIASGEVELNTVVTISCATEGVSIYYSTDGSTPSDMSDNSKEYGQSGITIDKAMTIKAIAYNDDWDESEVAEVTYTIKGGDPSGGDEPGSEEPVEPTVATPVFKIGDDVVTGTKEVTSGTQVSISCATEGATVTYTTNGNDPDDFSTEYGETIPVTKAMTLKAVAYVYGTGDDYSTYYSEVATVSFTIQAGTEPEAPAKPATPVFSINDVAVTDATKEVEAGTQVSISCTTTGAKVVYTTNGNEPDEWSQEYEEAISVNKAMTLKAVAYVYDDDLEPSYSDIATVAFTIAGGGEDPGTDPEEPTVAAPVFKIGDEVVSGTKEVEAGTQVSISCTTDGTTIYYTTNGDTPTDFSGTEYTSSIPVNTAMTIKAIAYNADYDASDEAQVSFTIKGGEEPVTVATPVFKIGGVEVSGTVEMVSGVETKVSISCATAGAKIYYTDDNSNPASSWMRESVTNGGLITFYYPKTIRAIAELGNAKSEEAKIEFTEKSDEPGGDEPGGDEPGGDEPVEPGEAVEVPFISKFESAADFAAQWVVSDHDGDKMTWRYVTGLTTFDAGFDGSYENGYAKSGKNEETETADYMMTKSPLRMPAGEAHVAFKYALGSYSPVHLKVYYSKTFDAELSGMTLLGELEKSEKYHSDNGAWYDTAMAFTLAEAGDYYFCFVHCSEPDEFGINVNGIYIDNVIIDAGRFVPTPELKVEHVILPLSSCALGTAETVLVRVRSVGTEKVTNMSLSYQVDGGAAVTEQFTVSLATSMDTTLEFAHKADFSEAGKTYTVSVSCTVEGEKDLTDNEGSARVTNFTPVEALPFVVNTAVAADLDQLGFDSEAWSYDEQDGFGNWGIVDPLVTRCMPLKAGQTYRFSFDRKTGVDLGVMQLPESFWVVYAPAGSDNTTILKFYEGDYTSGESVHEELSVTPASDGNYYFGIVPDANCCNASLFISRMSVEKVGEHDVCVAGMSTSLAKRTPAKHALAPEFKVMVVNRGQNDENVKVTVKDGDTEIGSSEITLKKADTAYCRVQGKLTGLKPGEEKTLRIEAGIAAEATPADNTLDWTFTTTDSLYAFDKDMPSYEQAMTSKYVIGHIFTLSQADTLTGLMLGWFSVVDAIPFGVEIYPVTEEVEGTDYYKVGNCLFSKEFKRQAESGLEIIAMPRVGLPAGRYFIGLKRLESALLHVGFDKQPEGKFYMLSAGTLYSNADFGYIALRALFGAATGLTGNDLVLTGNAQLKSYPNPVSGLWTVEARGLEINRVEIADMAGAVVYRSADRLAAETWQVDMAGFKPGLYVARVYTNAGLQAVKVVVR